MPALSRRPLLLILVFSGLCFFTRLGGPQLWDRDEPRNARCAWEMMERNDWVVPTFNDELRTHKPILLYWLMMSAYGVMGVHEFSARFWSAALSVGTVGLTYQMGRRLFDSKTGQWAAIVLASTLMFNVAAHAATPDAALIFCTTLAMSLFVRSVPWEPHRTASPRCQDRDRIRPDRKWLTAAGFALGLGVLAKGPVGFVLPVAVWCLFLWTFSLSATISDQSSRQPHDLAWPARWKHWLLVRLHPSNLWRSLCVWHPVTVTLAMLVIAAPWYVLVGFQTDGVWLRDFFIEHNVSRAVQPMEGHRGNMFLFYPVAILVGFFPWSALAIPAAIWVSGRRDSEAYDARFGLLIAWLGLYVVAFSLAGTKLPSYVTPTYPALAIMVGHFLVHWPGSNQAPAVWWPRWSAATLILVGTVLVIALPWAAHQYLPGEESLGAIGLVLLVGGGLCLRSFWRHQIHDGRVRLAVTSLCFIVMLFGWVAPRISRHQHITHLLATADRIDAGAPLASFGVHEPSWVFYAGRTISLLSGESPQRAVEQLEDHQGFLITTRQRYAQLRDQLPAHTTLLDDVPYFLRDDELVLIGPSSVSNARAVRSGDHGPNRSRR